MPEHASKYVNNNIRETERENEENNNFINKYKCMKNFHTIYLELHAASKV